MYSTQWKTIVWSHCLSGLQKLKRQADSSALVKGRPLSLLRIRGGRCWTKSLVKTQGVTLKSLSSSGFRDVRQVPAWSVRCGNTTRGVGASPLKTHQEAEQPSNRVQGQIHSKRFKSKYVGEKNYHLWEASATVYQIEKLLWTAPHLETTANSHYRRHQTQRYRKGNGFCWWRFGFSTKAGRKQRFNTWVQTHSGATRPRRGEERPGSKPRLNGHSPLDHGFQPG